MKRNLFVLSVAGAFLVLSGCSIKPVTVLQADGPDKLLTDEAGTFEAAVNEEATQPVTTTWDFGDGSTASGLTASHSYSSPGTYTVTFSAQNKKRRKTSMDSEAMTVVVELPVAAPTIVTVTATPPSPDTRSVVQFAATVRDDARETTRYSWDFGDGSTSSDVRPTHTFGTEGTYTAQLTVSNSAGQASRTLTLTVLPYEAAICRELTDLNSAFFDRNSSTLKDEARAALQENANILNECPNVCAKIEGFAVGNERSAQSLSEARARAVEQFYLDNGVSASRLVAEGRGRVPGVSAKDGLSQFRRADSIPNACRN